MRLALYSDQILGQTDEMDADLREWLPEGGTVGYLPSAPDPDRYWFGFREDYYREWGLRARYFGLEEEHIETEVDALFACDAIHLSGGNTFRFLHWLQRRDLLDRLRRYAHEGGVLIGVSAGAILMTSEVATSLLCGDVPYHGSQSGRALALVNFALVPHFDGSSESRQAIARYARESGDAVIGLSDRSGILVHEGQAEAFGSVYWQSADHSGETLAGRTVLQMSW